VHDDNNYLFRLRKDVSFLNKPALKNKLESVPQDSFVLIDVARADFIDKDIVEVIEDFMIHAPLKKIRVELKSSRYREQGFTRKILPHTSTTPIFDQGLKKTSKTEEA
jgi:MFS superfamily sulfate permease-like transporter